MTDISGHSQKTPRRGALSEQAPGELEEIQRSALAGDAWVTLEGLYKSGLLDGLVRRIESGWSALTREDAEDVVAEAVDSLYTYIRRGKFIQSIGAWLWKVASRKAYDLEVHRRRERRLEPGDEEAIEAPSQYQNTPNERDDHTPEEKRIVALRVARRLLPMLGMENVQKVMSYLFDAVEEGVEDLSPKEIGDALGLERNTVSKCLERGFNRLRERASEHGEVLVQEELARLQARRT